ncbi:unnamed protein product [Microthlaspi erraticum]|uniref:HMA domain-containing protein n=1 Tax=Microthlaspi erraticum TaxID=1685480 RepID=A0A6D2IYC5_9BRAS|nr:unnamed protein product [Microthlaspi erraticum]
MEGQRPPVHEQTRVLKLQPNCCTGCVRKVKRAMLKVEGVHSIKVNANEGTIEVKSDVDPQLLIAIAAKAGKRAELLWEPQPESSPATPPPVTTPSTDHLASQLQVKVNNFDQTVNVQDLVDKNARGIKHMEIVDKRVIKIMFKEPNHDDPSGGHSRDTPSTSNSGGGEARVSGVRGDVEIISVPAAEPPASIPHEINNAPTNSKPAEPPVANVNCKNGRNSCRVM